MPDRKQFFGEIPVDEELAEMLDQLGEAEVTEDELHEQRISFAYGNALAWDEITKDSVRRSSENIRIRS